MSSIEDLDDLIARLERAAEQLRSGEVSPDAAATHRRGVCGAGGQGGDRARAAHARGGLAAGAGESRAGQDTLL